MGIALRQQALIKEVTIMTTTFKELNIQTNLENLTGDQIKISKILNRQITVEKFRIVPSKFHDKGNGKRLDIQIKFGDETRMVWTGSQTLMDQILKVPQDKFPFTTTIIEENERFQFT